MKTIAHRGSQLLWPENTMLAFDKAHDAGAIGFEADLRLSRDKEIILSHDNKLSRFGHPDKTVSRLEREEIEQIEIFSRDRNFSDKLISLRALLQKYPEKEYIFDCKISDRRLFEKLKELLAELHFHSRFSFLNCNRAGDKYVREFFPGQKVFPRVVISTLWGWASLLRLGGVLEPRNQSLALPAYYLTVTVFSREQVSSIAKRGKIFVGYLVNSERAYRRCKEVGVGTVLTDRPDLIAGFEGTDVPA